jgi:3-methyl-2-oxobutanoate hydroxymethyltransferase
MAVIPMKRMTVPDILARKASTPLVALTAYTAPMARILDNHVDILLVGDSLGMVVYGMESTLGVTLDMMENHGRAVASQAKHALVVVDLPFGSYQESTAQAFASSARVMNHTGCQAVKLEGGKEMADTIRFLTERGVPVMGHVGLMPQRVHAMGGYKYQGRSDEDAQAILEDALAVEAAGAFAIVLEGVKESLARDITTKLRIPTIGIGASPACDGQVLVIDDMLGMGGYIPSFVKNYAHIGQMIEQAAKTYGEEVRNRTFPSPEYCFPFKKKAV